MSTLPFSPGPTVTLAATSTNANRTAIGAASRGNLPVQIKNRSYVAGDGIYFRFGTADTTKHPNVTSATGMLIGPGEERVVTIPPGMDHVLHLAQQNNPELELTVGSFGG